MNIKEFFEYRGAPCEHKFVSQVDFSKQFGHYGYTHIASKNNDLHVVLLGENSSQATKTADFRSLLSKLNIKEDNITPKVIFITQKPFNSFIQKAIAAIHSSMNIIIENHLYEIFSIVIPKYVGTPAHRILTEEEAVTHENKTMVPRAHMPKIKLSDPMSVWLGVSPGAIVEIERISENSVLQYSYRHVIK